MSGERADEFGIELCRHFGIEPHRVRRIVIDVEACRLPTVQITTTSDDLLDIVTRYELRPIADPTPAPPSRRHHRGEQ